MLTRHDSGHGHRWAFDGQWLEEGSDLSDALHACEGLRDWAIARLTPELVGEAPLVAPVPDHAEIWASGVTYLRSREARMGESQTADIYDKVYDADRAELFFKAPGWRSIGHQGAVRVRQDATWNVPEPEITLVLNSRGELAGYTAGNDMSSRDIEGENPLYLPQAKVYDGSCGLGPAIVPVTGWQDLDDLDVSVSIERGGSEIFSGRTSRSQMKRSPEELAQWLFRELAFPQGSLLMTGTGVVPPDDFTLASGDNITICVGELTLKNTVAPS